MIYATLYRRDLVTGEVTQALGRVILGRGTLEHLHTLATQAASRNHAHGYQISEGATFASGRPISLVHQVKE